MGEKFNPLAENAPEISEIAEEKEDKQEHEKSDMLKALEYGINQLVDDSNLEKKSDLTPALITALAMGKEFAKMFECVAMSRLVENTLQLRVSKERKGRGEIAKVLSSISQLGREEEKDDDPDRKWHERLMGK